MLEIEKIKSMTHPSVLAITRHAKNRLQERKIKVEDIISCINTGEIIKQYEVDKPLPSCLILGKTKNGKSIHVVVSCDDEYVYLITAYYPDADLWESDLKTRKE